MSKSPGELGHHFQELAKRLEMQTRVFGMCNGKGVNELAWRSPDRLSACNSAETCKQYGVLQTFLQQLGCFWAFLENQTCTGPLRPCMQLETALAD